MPRPPAHPTAARDRLADHLPALRAMLENHRQFRLEQLAELDTLVEDAAPTTAVDLARHEVAVKLAAAARHALADIDRALALVATGGYGRCGDCHADIPLHLLRALPASRLCLPCRQAAPRSSRRSAGRTHSTAPHAPRAASPRRRAELGPPRPTRHGGGHNPARPPLHAIPPEALVEPTAHRSFDNDNSETTSLIS